MKLQKLENKTLMEELVPIYTTDKDIKVVNARELYQILGVKKDFSNWIKSNLKDYKMAEPVENTKNALKGELDFDYFVLEIKGDGPRKRKEYILTLDTAKELAMMSRCEKGREVRKYFIEVEKAFNEMVNTLSNSEMTTEEKISEALILAQGVIAKQKDELIKANRNKEYNKKVNVQLRRKVRELEAKLAIAENNPNSSNEDIENLKAQLEEAVRQKEYFEGAVQILENKVEQKENQIAAILLTRRDGKRYFDLLANKHASAIPERNNDDKLRKARTFRKQCISNDSKVKYGRTMSASFIERIHPQSIAYALDIYLKALENRLGNNYEDILSKELINEIQDFIDSSEI